MTFFWTCAKCGRTNDSNMTRTVCLGCGKIKDPTETYEELSPSGVPKPSDERLGHRRRRR